MNRRTLLMGAAAVPLLPAKWPFLPASARAAVTSASGPVRRVRPSDPAWPDAAKWEKLKRDVGGRLIKVQSPLAACDGRPDGTACRDVFKELKNPAGLFFVHHGVGSEEWSADGFTRLTAARRG